VGSVLQPGGSKSTLAAIQEEQEEAGGCDDSDFVIQHMLRNKIALTQSNLAPSMRGRSTTSRR
jgi:hypothetical protein